MSKDDKPLTNACIYYKDSEGGSHEIHVGSDGSAHVHDDVDETRNGSKNWDETHRKPTDTELSIINEVAERGYK